MPRYELIRPERPSMLQRFLRSITLGPFNPKDKTIAKYFGGAPSSTGIPVNEFSALNYSAYFSALALVSGDVASLPLCLYRRDGKNAERYEAHPLYRLLHDSPNPEMSSVVFRETLQAHAMSWGNGYAEIERDNAGRPRALWPITPDRVEVQRGAGGALGYKVQNQSTGSAVILPAADMLHIPGLGFDGIQGYSVASMARESIGLGIAAERFGGTFFGNGASFGGVFEHPGRFTEQAQKNWKAFLAARHHGVDRAHNFLVVEEGMKYQRLGIPPEDAQFLETRQFQVTEIARWFNIPPHKIGDLSRATFSNIEQQNIEYLQITLIHWLVRWEQELRLKLISPLERNQQYIKHVTEGFLRGDSSGRAALQSSEFNIGAATSNEVRALSERNPVDGGDIAFVPLNMIPLNRALDYWDAQIAKLKEPPPAPVAPPKEGDDEPDPDLEAARARIEQLVADNTEKDIARRQAEQRAEDLAAAQAEAETKRDEMAADLAHEIELRAGAETALEAEKVEHALTREQDAARYGDLDTRYQQKVEEYLDQVQLSETFLGERDVATAEVSRLMTTLLAMKESAEEATRQHQEEVSKYATEREALTQELNAAARLKVEAVNAQHDAEAAREAAIQRAEAAECDKGTAEQAHQAAAVLLEEQRQQERTRLIGVIAAHRALIADVMSRMVERETEKARRHQATPEKLRKWADGFYSLHEQTCVEALTPALRAHLAWLQSAEEPEAVARGIVRTHIRESLTQLRAVADADPDEYHGLFERTLTRWETERPAALADAVQKEAISHVAGL